MKNEFFKGVFFHYFNLEITWNELIISEIKIYDQTYVELLPWTVKQLR